MRKVKLVAKTAAATAAGAMLSLAVAAGPASAAVTHHSVRSDHTCIPLGTVGGVGAAGLAGGALLLRMRRRVTA